MLNLRGFFFFFSVCDSYLQIGELCDTSEKSYGDGEIRVLITHVSPGREPLLEQLSRHVQVIFFFFCSFDAG
jgi:hypothetical protein